jgi:predicted RNA-binding protein YlxR (DUF448 family)
MFGIFFSKLSVCKCEDPDKDLFRQICNRCNGVVTVNRDCDCGRGKHVIFEKSCVECLAEKEINEFREINHETHKKHEQYKNWR